MEIRQLYYDYNGDCNEEQTEHQINLEMGLKVIGFMDANGDIDDFFVQKEFIREKIYAILREEVMPEVISEIAEDLNENIVSPHNPLGIHSTVIPGIGGEIYKDEKVWSTLQKINLAARLKADQPINTLSALEGNQGALARHIADLTVWLIEREFTGKTSHSSTRPPLKIVR